MRDKTIISIISKTYFSIVSLFIFIFLLLFSLFIILQNGLLLSSVTISNVHIEELYIKWNEKIDVSIKEVTLSSSNETTAPKISKSDIKKYLLLSSRAISIFNSFVIEKITIDDIDASFKYTQEESGYLVAASPDFSLHTLLYFKDDALKIKIKKLVDTKRKITFDGNILLDRKSTSLYTDIHISINNEADFNFYSRVNLREINYTLKSNKDIQSLDHILSLVTLPKELHYWIVDAIKMKNVSIDNMNGFIEFDKPSEAYKNVYISAYVNGLDYKYNPKLDAIHTQKTQLEFSKGIFYIRPMQAYSYNMYLGKSWLKIDFTKKEELLTLNLIFDGKLNKDMLKILNTYKIKLPFLQKSGLVKTDLKIDVNLMTIDVKAKGSFFTKKANFDYLGLNLNIYDTFIKLNNYDVTIDKMRASYKDIAKADVRVKYNAKTEKGSIKFKLREVELAGISLDKKEKPLLVTYNIVPKKDTISIAASKWIYDTHSISVEKIVLPFNLQKLIIEIPTTYVKLDNIAESFVSGNIDIHNFKTQLDIDILKLKYLGLELAQSNTPIKLKYDKKLSIYAENEIFFNISGSPYSVNNLYFDFLKDKIYLKHTHLNIGQYIKTKIYAAYNIEKKSTHISLTNFILTNPLNKNIIYKNKKIILSIMSDKDEISVKSQALNATFTSKNDGWSLNLHSLDIIENRSSLLKKFEIDAGELRVYKSPAEDFIRFDAKLLLPYKIFVENNKPLSKYNLKGTLKADKIDFIINKKIKVRMRDTIKIFSKDYSINIWELLKYIKNFQADANSSPLKFMLNGKNTSIYLSEKRTIISDSLKLQYLDKVLTAQLKYKDGSAGLKYADDVFHLYGKNFNDEFMEEAFSLAKLKGGKMDFTVSGKADKFSGILFITKTTITDYAMINNILAFVNTIPSLITFSVPGYDRKGLFVEKAYVKVSTDKEIYTISDIHLDSKELDILGNGVIDTGSDKIDMTLNLKTDLASDISKVPLLGHVIFDGDSISTTLKIKGKLSNPEVNSMIAKEIIVAPFNIIKRTLLLPYTLVKDATSSLSEKKQSK